MSNRKDPDPTPWEWTLKGGSPREWAPHEGESETIEVEHTPVPTAEVTVERSYTLGRHTRTTTYRLITTLPNPRHPNTIPNTPSA